MEAVNTAERREMGAKKSPPKAADTGNEIDSAGNAFTPKKSKGGREVKVCAHKWCRAVEGRY